MNFHTSRAGEFGGVLIRNTRNLTKSPTTFEHDIIISTLKKHDFKQDKVI